MQKHPHPTHSLPCSHSFCPHVPSWSKMHILCSWEQRWRVMFWNSGILPFREKRQRERLLLTWVDSVAFINIWIDLDAWTGGGVDCAEGHASVRVICRAGRNEQRAEAQGQQCGAQDCHGRDLSGNCWAWSCVRPHLYICFRAGVSGWGHTCKFPSHRSLKSTGF